MFVVTMHGASNTTAELINQKCHSSVTLVYCLLGADGLTTSIPAGVLITERLIMVMVISPEMANFTYCEGKSKLITCFFSKTLSSEFFT
jgi:threonine dehydratase